MQLICLLTLCLSIASESNSTNSAVIDTFCDTARVITISRKDVFTTETARLILAHNLKVKACNSKSLEVSR